MKVVVMNAKRRLVMYAVLGLPLILLPLSLFTAVAAQETATVTEVSGLKFVSMAIAILGSTMGAGIALYGVAVGGSALLAENPKAFTQVLILGGLAEGVAVYGLLVA
ncbi:MAG: ATP synthase subunit C, partial [Candidatus Korarchaeum sp.]|nr:ATP synthase subunit C [Candidatus Korarchaeum sp.]MDW8035143.1 ATP synthase subunit C [Candidatus Korarchaeum sp.]